MGKADCGPRTTGTLAATVATTPCRSPERPAGSPSRGSPTASRRLRLGNNTPLLRGLARRFAHTPGGYHAGLRGGLRPGRPGTAHGPLRIARATCRIGDTMHRRRRLVDAASCLAHAGVGRLTPLRAPTYPPPDEHAPSRFWALGAFACL